MNDEPLSIESYQVDKLQKEEYLEILDNIINAKVTYNKDKLVMAEELIGIMQVEARLLKLKLLKIGACGE